MGRKKSRVVTFFAYINGTTLTITNPFQRIPWTDSKATPVAHKEQ